MSFSFSKIFFSSLIAIFLLSFFYFNQYILAEDDLAVECEWTRIEKSESSLSEDAYRALLEKCKGYYEKKSDELQGDITKTEAEKNTLANTVSIFQNKIKSFDYQIQQGNIMIKDLGLQIDDTKVSISKTDNEIKGTRDKLENLLELRYIEDRKSIVEILLGERTMSDFFDNMVALDALNGNAQEFLKNIRGLKLDLEDQKVSMDAEQDDLKNFVIIQDLQKQESSKKKQEQQNLLNLTEQEYQKYLKEKAETEELASKIGSLLFEMIEVPEGGIKFEDAVQIAKDISKSTGVRAAFSLAIMWQETRIGKVLGGCYLKNTKNGDGIYIKTGNKAPRTMKASRDVEPFLSIIKSLNSALKLKTDAFNTPVSCCMVRNGEYFGYGGAMGPAQFIPSTWMEYKEEIEKATGDIPANPWNVRDAFLANGFFLKRKGAGKQTYETEIYSALKYFGCTSSWCKSNYGVPVMRASDCIQQYMDKGAMSASCQSLIF
ncbi:MAG: lytic murein transglycosylase [Parcubacteria group bacterium]|nr:lytic murein transglycosylase [Parcubacteria group bacterium]